MLVTFSGRIFAMDEKSMCVSIVSLALDSLLYYSQVCKLLLIVLSLSKIRPRRLTLRPYKEYWFVFKDTTISYFKNKEASYGEPIEQFHLRGQWHL